MITRRDFLKLSNLLAAVAMIPPIVADNLIENESLQPFTYEDIERGFDWLIRLDGVDISTIANKATLTYGTKFVPSFCDGNLYFETYPQRLIELELDDGEPIEVMRGEYSIDNKDRVILDLYTSLGFIEKLTMKG